MKIDLKKDLYVRLEDHKWHKARLIIRERKRYRYLYLVYRNGEKIEEQYVAKLANKEGGL